MGRMWGRIPVTSWLAPLLLIGCHGERTLTVVLPVGFNGHVSISCNDFLRRDLTLDYDSHDRDNIGCPKLAKQVTVAQEGVTLHPDVTVHLTNEGAPAQISFDVR
jgi:hypothetical protein